MYILKYMRIRSLKKQFHALHGINIQQTYDHDAEQPVSMSLLRVAFNHRRCCAQET